MTVTTHYPDRTGTDDYRWLEGIYDERALDWVAAQNAITAEALASPRLENAQAKILEVLDSTARIPMVVKHGPFLYNFWRDAEHPHGLWRRTTLESYRTPAPAWEILLDIDELCRVESKDWVFAGADLLFPDFTRALLRLSPDGGDAAAVREFDLATKAFVPGGFDLPVAKSITSWIDRDTIFVATDFGPDSLTVSGYPRQAKRLRRGQALADAELAYEAPVEHVRIDPYHLHQPGFERDLVEDWTDFFRRTTYLLKGGKAIAIEVPEEATVDFHREWLLVRPKTDWEVNGQTYPAGSLLAANFDAFTGGERAVTAIFTPDAHTTLERWSWTQHHLLLTLLRDVSSQIEVVTPGDGGWARRNIPITGQHLDAQASGVDDDESDDFWLVSTGFLTPPTLQLGTVGTEAIETLKSAPSFFKEDAFTVEQHFAASDDGTAVPYFQIASRDLPLDGTTPTLLTGYGGFEISRTPSYNGGTGRAWLEQGGVLVVANIRGGGEYGPGWHHAAMRENRPRAYEDFAAVAKDLIARKVTSPAHLGCSGGSNGGLLVGNMLTHYPELFGAIVCNVPLLDMQRYTKLSAGASWIAEYGDPDVPEDWAFIQTFSPYHNLRESVTYPAILFYTATSDDRVGPVQARKMAARMEARGIPNVFFYENREGGHAGSADNKGNAHMQALGIEFLLRYLV